MANARGKAVDNTHLSIDMAHSRGFIHRDYLAHCLRWTHVAKFLREKNRYKEAVVLDVGCGRDLPLARMLHTDRITPKLYVGVDYNKQDKLNTYSHNFGDKPFHFFGGIEFPEGISVKGEGMHILSGTKVKALTYFRLPTIITCFEVLEHVEPAHARKMVEKMAELAKASEEAGNECHIFISTPNWDPKVGAADNHVNEMLHQAVGYLLETSGLEILDVWGTFASQKDYDLADHANACQLGDDGYGACTYAGKLWDELSKYYDSNYLSTIFAPLFPAQARNCLWHCRIFEPPKNAGPDWRHFSGYLDDVPGPWTSSEHWADLRLKHHSLKATKKKKK